MLDYNKLGARIRELRLYEKMTQERLAEDVNVTSKHISNIENGASKVSVETLINIANSLNTTMDFILQDSILCDGGLEKEITSLLKDCSKEKKERLVEYLRSAIKIDLGS
jgi:transcriptional regulator with XRE-family HTH domain